MTQTVQHQGELLAGLADALNRLGEAGLEVTLKYGAAMTDQGYVLPGPGGAWVARLKIDHSPEG